MPNDLTSHLLIGQYLQSIATDQHAFQIHSSASINKVNLFGTCFDMQILIASIPTTFETQINTFWSPSYARMYLEVNSEMGQRKTQTPKSGLQAATS
jgi:hypothetical protein